MKPEASSEVRKRVAGHFSAEEGSAEVQGFEEGGASFHLLSAGTVSGLPPPSTAKQVTSWSTSWQFNDQSSNIDLGRTVSSPLATASRLWSFGSADNSLNTATADISIIKGQLTGMNRWKGDARKVVEIPEIVGGKADSADSSFGSTLSRKPKGDFKPRANQALKSQFKENLATSPFKQSMSQNHDVGSPMDLHRERDIRKQGSVVHGELLFPGKPVFVPQKGEQGELLSQEQVFDMQHIRSTILKQEAVFREQVRELHRVHKVQTLLMAEMRRKDFDLSAHSTGANVGGPSQSPAVYVMNPGPWNCATGQVLGTGNDVEASVALPETLKGGSTVRQRDSPASTSQLYESNLFKQSPRVRPVRRTFDLERPPDDEEDEQLERKENDSLKHDGNCVKVMESPQSCTNDTENEMFSLNLSTGSGSGEAIKDDREHINRGEYDISRGPKRPREEAALFPFLATKSESLRDAPLRPTPTVASQSFLGGLWGLQLGRKVDGSSTLDGDSSPEESEAPKKKERLSLNLGVEEKEVPTPASNGAPHWLLKAPAAKPPKKAVCQTESSSVKFQDSFSPPRNSSEKAIMNPLSQAKGESGSGSTPGMVWDAERHVSDYPPRNRSQSSHDGPEMAEDNMQAGARDVSQAKVVSVGLTGREHAGYGPLERAQGEGGAPAEALSLYSSWREVGDGTSENISDAVLTQSHRVAGGFGVHSRSFEGHRNLATQELVQVGPAVNIGIGSTSFVPDCGPGMWYQQTNSDQTYSDSQHQQHQRNQQLASRQTGVGSSPRQGPWHAPIHISQGGGYGQGPVFAIPAAGGPPLGFPLYSFQKVGDDVPGPNWTSVSVGPPFTPLSIVVPPKPPFKRPPKLVLTHDGTTMELKLVSPEREVGTKVIAEKSCSGSSGEVLSEKKERGHSDAAMYKGRTEDDGDVSMQSNERRGERGKTASNTGPMEERGNPASGGASDWIAKVMLTAAHRTSLAGRMAMQNVSATVVPMAQEEGMDDADGGNSDAGSGGSGVGDVINPGDRASPSTETFVQGGPNRNLPAGEGEEGVNMGELGLQADSESQSGRFNKKDKPRKNQEGLQGQLSVSLSFNSSLSTVARKISRENSDASGHVLDNSQKCVRGTEGLSDEAEKRALVHHHVLEPSGSSSRAIMNSLVKGSQSHSLCPQESLDELRNAQMELQHSTCSTSQSRMTHPSKLEDSLKKGKEISKDAESSALGLGTKVLREQYRGRVAMDVDDLERGKTHVGQKNNCFSNFGDVSKQERESKVGHSKQLSGANTSEKGGVQQKPFSPVLRQVPSPSSMVDTERHTEGSSKKVSQASETDQGNGRSPRRTSSWIGPSSTESDHFCSPGGIYSSCEEVDGTLTSCNDSSITWSELEEEVQRTW